MNEQSGWHSPGVVSPEISRAGHSAVALLPELVGNTMTLHAGV